MEICPGPPMEENTQLYIITGQFQMYVLCILAKVFEKIGL